MYFGTNFMFKVIDSKDEMISTLETSLDDGIVFAGGIKDASGNQEGGNAKIYALSFDENIEEIKSLALVIPGARPTGVLGCLNRIPDRDVLVCGVDQSVFLVEWTGSHFEILASIQDIHSGKRAIQHRIDSNQTSSQEQTLSEETFSLSVTRIATSIELLSVNLEKKH